LAAGARVLVGRRRDLARSRAIGCALVGAGAAVLAALAFALDAYASPGTWIVGLDAIAFLAAGVGVILRGPQTLHVAAAIWTGLVSVAVELLNVPIFLHPIVFAVLPAVIMRLLVATALGAGVSAAVVGCLLFSEIVDGVSGSTFRS